MVTTLASDHVCTTALHMAEPPAFALPAFTVPQSWNRGDDVVIYDESAEIIILPFFGKL